MPSTYGKSLVDGENGDTPIKVINGLQTSTKDVIISNLVMIDCP
jgi:hypothetical protein